MDEQHEYNPTDDAIQALARCLYPAIRAYFESEQGQREFAEWRARKSTAAEPEKPEKATDKLRQAV